MWNFFQFTATCALKQVFENATTDRDSPRRSLVKSASCELQLRRIVRVPPGSRSRSSQEGVYDQTNANNPITIKNRTHIDSNFFDRKDLEKSSPAVMFAGHESPCMKDAVYLQSSPTALSELAGRMQSCYSYSYARRSYYCVNWACAGLLT